MEGETCSAGGVAEGRMWLRDQNWSSVHREAKLNPRSGHLQNDLLSAFYHHKDHCNKEGFWGVDNQCLHQLFRKMSGDLHGLARHT